MLKNLYMENIGKKAKIASNKLSNLNAKKRNDVLKIFYKYLMQYSDLILKDFSNCKILMFEPQINIFKCRIK